MNSQVLDLNKFGFTPINKNELYNINGGATNDPGLAEKLAYTVGFVLGYLTVTTVYAAQKVIDQLVIRSVSK